MDLRRLCTNLVSPSLSLRSNVLDYDPTLCNGPSHQCRHGNSNERDNRLTHASPKPCKQQPPNHSSAETPLCTRRRRTATLSCPYCTSSPPENHQPPIVCFFPPMWSVPKRPDDALQAFMPKTGADRPSEAERAHRNLPSEERANIDRRNDKAGQRRAYPPSAERRLCGACPIASESGGALPTHQIDSRDSTSGKGDPFQGPAIVLPPGLARRPPSPSPMPQPPANPPVDMRAPSAQTPPEQRRTSAQASHHAQTVPNRQHSPTRAAFLAYSTDHRRGGTAAGRRL